ncbi:nicotinate-nucleotide adenylyltransferase [Tautonia sociabilis]|uniref:Probable nicotinate-nucleotide adenylyltransferase n=1 Tax=Tautonia sociabilis TaxID=2080755 RepID=A0A432MN36_9BACT|nr:nicotinate-nucleotide adenylyltransferase [Tautonia sociabilis]RUL88515.1 nicotinate-nucleotide adenylyltransferase [Tautonia sociabilis]
MRLGLFGGTFDPIHLGHLILAESCREAMALDLVWFVVAGQPPHKQREGRTPVSDRLEMVRIAIAGNPAFEVSEIEARSPGPHYTYRTLEEVARSRPGDELFFLIGGDSLADLPTWREPGRVMSLATVVAVGRPGTAEPPANATREILDAHPDARPIARVDAPLVEVSSRDLRRRVAEGRSIRYLVPRGVEAYIEAHRLYRPAP